jgi:hypothetical protein
MSMSMSISMSMSMSMSISMSMWGGEQKGGVCTPASHRSVQQRWWKEVTALRLLAFAIAALRGVLGESNFWAILECRRSKERLSIRNIFLKSASCRCRTLAQTDLRNSPLHTSLRWRLGTLTSSLSLCVERLRFLTTRETNNATARQQRTVGTVEGEQFMTSGMRDAILLRTKKHNGKHNNRCSYS